MKIEKDPASEIPNQKSKIKLICKICALFVFIFMFGFYYYKAKHIKNVYDNLNVSFSSVKEIEYGTANYNVLDLVEKVDSGTIKSYTKKIDTSKVGVQEIVIEVEKENVVKTFTVEVEIKDTNAPTITLKNEEISIYVGDEFDIHSNIESVTDVVDGDLSLGEEGANGAYYTVSSDFDNTKAGDYTVNIKAKDCNGNESESSYNIKVKEKPVIKTQVYSNRPATVDTSSVVAAANSLIGSRYVYGGNSPETGFDCSGFVQYVYSVVGKNISKSSRSQVNDGVAVDRSNMQAGDIIIWSTNGSTPTHASLYVGNNTIIHAINSSRGVQTSDVSYWEGHGGGHIVAIRRV